MPSAIASLRPRRVAMRVASSERVRPLEQRSEDAPAVERERGEEIEGTDQEVEPNQPRHDRPAEPIHRRQRDPGGKSKERASCRNGSAHRRAGDGDRELVAAPLGGVARASTPLRWGGDRSRERSPLDAERWRSAQAHAGRRAERSRRASESPQRPRTACVRTGPREERDQEEESHMDANLDTGDSHDGKRPAPSLRLRPVRRRHRTGTTRTGWTA